MTPQSTIILRSTCVGIASIVMAGVASMFVGGMIAAYRTPALPGEPEVGWDLVTTLHNYPKLSALLPWAVLGVFVIGFLIGFRYFSRTVAR